MWVWGGDVGPLLSCLDYCINEVKSSGLTLRWPAYFYSGWLHAPPQISLLPQVSVPSKPALTTGIMGRQATLLQFGKAWNTLCFKLVSHSVSTSLFYFCHTMGWIVSFLDSICWSPNIEYLRMWLHLEIESLGCGGQAKWLLTSYFSNQWTWTPCSGSTAS